MGNVIGPGLKILFYFRWRVYSLIYFISVDFSCHTPTLENSKDQNFNSNVFTEIFPAYLSEIQTEFRH